jgi:2-dehydropantoate 2-reductase
MGTGAVGAYFGGRLAAAGVPVTFVARGATLAALRRDGLAIVSGGRRETVAPVAAVDTPAAAGPCELVLVCVKSYDTAAAATALRPAVTAETVVLSLQNGIENEALLADRLVLPPLLGGVTHIGAELVAPAVVRHDSGGRIIFGEFDGRRSSRVERLAALFGAAGVAHRVSRDIAVMLWDKLAWNAAFNAVTAISRRSVGAVLADADGAALVRAAMLEVVAVARAGGIGLEAGRVDEALAHSAAALGALRTSMLQDRERGRQLEVDALHGAVLRAAARHRVDTPVTRVLHALVCMLDRAGG